MRKITVIPTVTALLVLLLGVAYFRIPTSLFFDVMHDRNGDWRIPTNGKVTRVTTTIINKLPRIDISFSIIDQQFDMDNEQYIQSTIMYIMIPGIIGLVFMIVVISLMLGRYFCNCCGGKNVRRKGYRESNINFYRYAIIVISFFLEAVLIYGYFANTDLHKGLKILTNNFNLTSVELKAQFDKVELENASTYNYSVDITNEDLQKDLAFSLRYAQGQATETRLFFKKYEIFRMLVIIFNLILSTIGCSLGIAAGSVHKGSPVLIMVILFAISDCLFFFSFGIHLAGSKLVLDYCSEIEDYTSPKNDEFLPMRLQYFVPCVSSPVYPFIQDRFIYKCLTSLDEFKDLCNKSNCTDLHKNITWDQIINESITAESFFYPGEATANHDNITTHLADTKKKCVATMVIENSTTCRWSKNTIYQDKFLLCTYTKDNLYMMMITQFAGSILLVILTILGIPAIKRFKYAGNANINGILDANKRFMGRHAKAKRTV